jgi:hypothetical protein
LSLTANGTPSRAPSVSPVARLSSDARASRADTDASDAAAAAAEVPPVLSSGTYARAMSASTSTRRLACAQSSLDVSSPFASARAASTIVVGQCAVDKVRDANADDADADADDADARRATAATAPDMCVRNRSRSPHTDDSVRRPGDQFHADARDVQRTARRVAIKDDDARVVRVSMSLGVATERATPPKRRW